MLRFFEYIHFSGDKGEHLLSFNILSSDNNVYVATLIKKKYTFYKNLQITN